MTNTTSSARAQIWGKNHDAIEANLHKIDSDLADLVTRVAYDEVIAREGLDLRTRELLAITALMSVGTANEIKTHIKGALHCGATPTEIKESILQAAMYLGFPKALAAMKVFREVCAPEES